MLKRRSLLLSAAGLASLPLAGLATTSEVKVEPSPVRVPILLDTDIGSDIDDAVALAYLLRQPACELLGVTTVTGQPTERARLARALCDAANVHIPIVPGIAEPLVIAQRQTEAAQIEKLKEANNAPFPNFSAIAFMREMIRARPGEITLLAIGPFTNVAALFRLDPEIPALLKQLVVMGGKFSDYPTPWGPTEWNAIVDPHATQEMLANAGHKVTAYGLDITWQVSMTPEEVSSAFANDALLRIVRDWSEVWFRERELLHFHDPLAAAAIFKPDICDYTHGHVEVDLATPETSGITRFTPDTEGPVRVATAVRPNQFFDEYFSPFQASTQHLRNRSSSGSPAP